MSYFCCKSHINYPDAPNRQKVFCTQCLMKKSFSPQNLIKILFLSKPEGKMHTF